MVRQRGEQKKRGKVERGENGSEKKRIRKNI